MTPKVYSIDIDGTLTVNTCWTGEEAEKAEPNQAMIDKVNELYMHNFIVIHTARRHELYHPTIKWLDKHGVRYHAVRFEKMPSNVIIDLDAINEI